MLYAKLIYYFRHCFLVNALFHQILHDGCLPGTGCTMESREPTLSSQEMKYAKQHMLHQQIYSTITHPIGSGNIRSGRQRLLYALQPTLHSSREQLSFAGVGIVTADANEPPRSKIECVLVSDCSVESSSSITLPVFLAALVGRPRPLLRSIGEGVS